MRLEAPTPTVKILRESKSVIKTAEEILETLYEKSGDKPGLTRMRALDKAFGYPSKAFRTIHVAGTNGKGSVCTMIAASLTGQGYKTGLYTSPHIHSCQERIRIDGQMISQEALSHFLNAILEVSVEVSFFEAFTMLSFLYFRQEKVSFAVIETGLGGEFDATNIIEPNLSVITNITYDHTHILGSTLEEIAQSKAGIIKPETPVILGSRAIYKPMLSQAFRMRSPLYFMPPIADWIEENHSIAAKALSVLFGTPIPVDPKDRPQCRFDVEEINGIKVIFDIAHNPDGLTKLFEKIKATFPDRNISVLFGMSASKDIQTAVQIIENYSISVFAFDTNHPRMMKKSLVENFLQKQHEKDLQTFLTEVKAQGNLLVVTGSAYIMKEIKIVLK